MGQARLLTLALLTGLSLPGQSQAPSITAYFNAASFAAGPVAPGELVALFGAKFCSSSAPCSGTSVLINGGPATVIYATGAQVAFQAPEDLTGSSATLQVSTTWTSQTLTSPLQNITVAAAAPGLFTTDASGTGTVTSYSGNTPAGPIFLLGTGFGASPAIAATSVMVGGVAATVTYIGDSIVGPLGPGYQEVAFVPPASLPSGSYPVVVTIDGAQSQSVTLPLIVPPVQITAVSNAADGQSTIVSGSWVSIYGISLATSTRPWQSSDIVGGNLPLTLDGVSVKINGKDAAISYVSPVQLNVQSPTDAALGPVSVEVTNELGSATGSVTLAAYSPAFFTFPKYVAAVGMDGAYIAPANFFGAAVASRPAKPGETVAVYGTGFGPTNPAVTAGIAFSGSAPLSDPSQLAISIGGVNATVLYAGLVAAGEYQFNVTIPSLPDGDSAIVATIGGISSPSALIPIQN